MSVNVTPTRFPTPSDRFVFAGLRFCVDSNPVTVDAVCAVQFFQNGKGRFQFNSMSRSLPITKAELEAIKQSVADARGRFVPAHMGFFSLGKPGELIQLDGKLLLQALRWSIGRGFLRLNSAPVKKLLIEAIDAGDEKFFIKLGRALSGKPVSFLNNRPPNDLENFLLNHWAESKDGLPELFYLTPAALTRLCRSKLGKAGLSQDVVVKTRQRLGLKAFKRQKRDIRARGHK